MEYDPDDLLDAVQYVSDVFEMEIDADKLKLRGVIRVDPLDFIDDASHAKGLKAGWLRDRPQSEWAEALRYEHDRNFEHIIDAYLNDRIMPGIRINDQMGDGRGRALFHHAIGKKMKVAEFTAPKET